jgi:glyoxylase-like metal-dependent hydrolase (beta-lactamase superfamily II)
MIDPAYAVGELLDVLAGDDMRCVGVLATHYHADHVGGDLAGYPIEGVARLLELASIPIHVQREEAPWVIRAAGVTAEDLVEHASGDIVTVGEIPIELVHTPGHTPGSQCFSIAGALVSGDTLFLDGCGRTDLPGSDPAAMYESLTTRLARFPDGTVLFPGHRYAPESSATMGETRARNMVFRPRTSAEWLAVFG